MWIIMIYIARTKNPFQVTCCRLQVPSVANETEKIATEHRGYRLQVSKSVKRKLLLLGYEGCRVNKIISLGQKILRIKK